MLAGIRQSSAFSPLSLFAAGEQGVWYDPSDFSSMFQDSAGTTPVTAVEQPVGKINDKSGRGNHATQATAAARPKVSARINVLQGTELFGGGDWATFAGLTKVGAAPINGPNGNLAYEIAFGTTGGAIGSASALFQSVASANSNFSLYVRAKTGTTTVRLSTGGTGTADTTVTDAAWTRIDVTDAAAENSAIRNNTAGNSANVYIAQAQLTPGSVPITYQRVATSTDYDTVGFKHYLAFDGVDDSMATAAINFTATNKLTAFAGVQKAADNSMFAELSVDSSANAGSFYLYAFTDSKYYWRSAGTVAVQVASAALTPPQINVLTGIGDISAPASTLRVNGSQVATSAASQGTGNYGTYPLYIGARGGTSFFLNGRMYSLIVRGAASSAGEITNTETHVNGKTGAY